jgi:putative nucleotidyltransferase with HDIG domain
LIFLLSARLALPAHAVIPYVFPLAAYGLTIAALFGPELAIVSSLPLVFLVAFGLSDKFDLTIFYLVTSLFGILSLGRARRISSFFRAGAVIAITGAVVVVVYYLPIVDAAGLATLAGAAVINGLASASLGILLQFFLAQLLGMISPMQLMDLSRPDHPLLQILLQEAPGTYQHSLQVANLAEQAAERIGADPLLTRVGTLYHDVGKTKAPSFFIENQPIGFPNPHDLLPPQDSSQIIQAHVTDGLELGRKHRLPRRIMDFIAEHHGTMLTRYQYFNALNAVDGDKSQVDENAFRYPGPKPCSRETAILMLADGCEARVRAERPEDVGELRKLIKDMVDDRIEFGQLDETNLTFHDLSEIVDSFTATMRGIYHPRVQYPQLESGIVEDTTPVLVSDAPESTAELPVDVQSETSG